MGGRWTVGGVGGVGGGSVFFLDRGVNLVLGQIRNALSGWSARPDDTGSVCTSHGQSTCQPNVRAQGGKFDIGRRGTA